MSRLDDRRRVTTLRDVPYGEADGMPLLLDVLHPDPLPSAPPPAVVWVHGGGWESGDKEEAQEPALNPFLAAHGFFTVGVNYRLSDQSSFPAQLHDVKAAVRWLRANATHLGINPERIGVWGHSAGGHLAALLGATGDLPALEGDSGSPGYSSRVQAVVAVSAPSDFTAIPPGWTHAEPRRATSKLVGGPLEQHLDAVRLANPIAHLHGDAPPFLLIHGERDEIVPVEQADLLYRALQRAGVPATFIPIPGANHSLAGPNPLPPKDARWAEVGRRALDFFARALVPVAPLRHGDAVTPMRP